MGFARKDVEATKRCEKKFVRYQEGAEKYSLGLTKFQADLSTDDVITPVHSAEPSGLRCVSERTLCRA